MHKSSVGCTVLRGGKAGGFGGRYLVVSHKDGARAGGKRAQIYLPGDSCYTSGIFDGLPRDPITRSHPYSIRQQVELCTYLPLRFEVQWPPPESFPPPLFAGQQVA